MTTLDQGHRLGTEIALQEPRGGFSCGDHFQAGSRIGDFCPWSTEIPNSGTGEGEAPSDSQHHHFLPIKNRYILGQVPEWRLLGPLGKTPWPRTGHFCPLRSTPLPDSQTGAFCP